MAIVRAALAAGIALLMGSAGCRRASPPPARPDIVLIVVDTLRADHLGLYGYARDISPHVDALGRRGTVFDAAWSSAPWTLPSVMSILTGRHASAHRVENDGLKLAPDVPLLAEILGKAGYSTGGFVSHVYVSRRFGFERGFGTYEDFGLSEAGYRLEAGLEPDAASVTDAALAWLPAQAGRPVFLFVHYFDPHWPYAAPGEDRDRFPSDYAGPLGADYDSLSRFQDPGVPMPEDYRTFLVNRYDGEIRFTDRQIGRLVEGLRQAGRAGRAWIVLTADHGEEFRDHGSIGHGRRLYEEVVRVPLVVAPPEGDAGPRAGGDAGGSLPAAAGDAREGRRSAEPVATIDILPTVLDLAGAGPAPAGVRGRSLAPYLRGEASGPPSDRTLVSETIRLNAYRKAARHGPLKLVHFMDAPRRELYDLAADPAERRDLAPARPGETRHLTQALFAEVDVLSGGWNLRWSSDGVPRRFQGQIRTGGVFRTVVPLFAGEGTYDVAGSVLNFSDTGQRSGGGLSFTTAPYEATVEFYLLVDGRADPQAVVLGGNRARPRGMPFSLGGAPDSEAAFARPSYQDGRDLGFFMWRVRPAGADQEVVLDDEIRERLRSLGYID